RPFTCGAPSRYRFAYGSHGWFAVGVAGGPRGRAASVQPAWPCRGAGGGSAAAAAPGRASGPGPGPAGAGSESGPAALCATVSATGLRTDRDIARGQPARPSPGADGAQVAGRLPHTVQRPGESGG